MNTLDLEQIYRLFFLLRQGWEPALGACPAQEGKNLVKRKRWVLVAIETRATVYSLCLSAI